MKKYLQKKLNNEKGMTLIELLAVIVIIAIIAAIAIPAISNIIQNSREDALVADAQNVLSAATLFFAENETATTVGWAGGEAANGLDDYLEDTGNITSFTVTKDNGTTPTTIEFAGTAGSETFTGVSATKAQLDAGRSVLE
ncbi:prepilin-type N-terminal cleavage/methylation domain-containing protein [Planococcus sp. CPCC 101016]|uniref:prepilin-type N-terminal cleavage/methylation domain-containing protein n=1 Tax=Planococcus sp. CPCC 101016 TaxID=2599617 RepID=UPI0011B5BB31|nr:prepilin-type N-terminal cleavage/methylation domain-containing protein [Planococcus sp. CPCC 101016]TWT08338.1 prepilin-type N-terminal cleavage/methylation domain-containing protein [Planococcus sp. CPCC 101016]